MAYHFACKVAVVGDRNVGKTTLLDAGLGGTLFDGSLCLSRYLEFRHAQSTGDNEVDGAALSATPGFLAGKSVVELGAGCGLGRLGRFGAGRGLGRLGVFGAGCWLGPLGGFGAGGGGGG